MVLSLEVHNDFSPAVYNFITVEKKTKKELHNDFSRYILNKGQLRDLILLLYNNKMTELKHFFPGINSHWKLQNCFPFTQMVISGILDHS